MPAIKLELEIGLVGDQTACRSSRLSKHCNTAQGCCGNEMSNDEAGRIQGHLSLERVAGPMWSRGGHMLTYT